MGQLAVLIMIIPLMLMSLSMFIYKESDKNSEALQSFECGFESFSLSRKGFSLKFFMVVVIFLVFDVEIVLVLAIPLSSAAHTYSMWVSVAFIMISILIFGLWLEWRQGVFEWTD